VSVRTIERDLGALLQAGVPIFATPGPGGGYALVMVPDVAGMCGRLEDLGGKVTVGVTEDPQGLVYALVNDPSGNLIGLFSPPAE
jgi:uncharacterized protein